MLDLTAFSFQLAFVLWFEYLQRHRLQEPVYSSSKDSYSLIALLVGSLCPYRFAYSSYRRPDLAYDQPQHPNRLKTNQYLSESSQPYLCYSTNDLDRFYHLECSVLIELVLPCLHHRQIEYLEADYIVGF